MGSLDPPHRQSTCGDGGSTTRRGGRRWHIEDPSPASTEVSGPIGDHLHRAIQASIRRDVAPALPEVPARPGRLPSGYVSVLVPIVVLTLKVYPQVFVGWSSKVWIYRDGSRVAELSTRCLPTVGSPSRPRRGEYFASKDIEITGDQHTKTKPALEFYAAELQAQRSAAVETPGSEDLGAAAGQPVARVEDFVGDVLDRLPVEGVVVGEHEHEVGGRELRLVERHQFEAGRDIVSVDERVSSAHVRPERKRAG